MNEIRDLTPKDRISVTLAEYFGCIFREGKGSHFVYTHFCFGEEEHTLPRQKPMGVIYVKKAIANIERIKECKEDDGNGK
ncbi:hypothetical protein [Phascolarctobacterium faecium]|uniref:hypothetical protein n=1 Tax=Phascolarctobacterium faecium TaxID=33025 RepID=UPI003076BC08